MNSSDPRFSHAAWMRYEPTIEAWLEHYPSAFVFFPQGLSIETTLARIRDAVKAKLHFHYPSKIDEGKLAQAWSTVVVTYSRHTKGAIRIGPKEGKVVIQVGYGEASSVEGRNTLSIFQPLLDDLLSVAHLLNRGIITTEVQITDCDPRTKSTFLERVSDFHNVAVNSDDTGNFTLF